MTAGTSLVKDLFPLFRSAEKSALPTRLRTLRGEASGCWKSGGAGGTASCRGFRGEAPKPYAQHVPREPESAASRRWRPISFFRQSGLAQRGFPTRRTRPPGWERKLEAASLADSTTAQSVVTGLERGSVQSEETCRRPGVSHPGCEVRNAFAVGFAGRPIPSCTCHNLSRRKTTRFRRMKRPPATDSRQP